MATHHAHFGIMDEENLRVGQALATTRTAHFAPGEELHLFTIGGGHVCLTRIHRAEEADLQLWWSGRVWTLRPWQSGDGPAPPVEDEGSALIEFWTVKRSEAAN
jgi:hypothetical protein